MGQSELTEADVFEEEREWLQARSQRLSAARRRIEEAFASAAEVKPESFSIALSGGGIRAAAFQAGVLWRLAQAGQLQEAEYLAAVSGGGYLASSFASHLAAADSQPQSGATRKEVADFYLDVLAKTFCRMQQNAGGFLRDPTAGPKGERSWRIAFRLPRDGSGMLPRIFDGVLLLLTLATTLALNPLQITVVWLVPFTEALNVFYGTALRIAFCTQGLPHWQILWDWSPYGTFLRFFELTAGVNFAFWLLSRFAKRAKSSSASPRCYLFVNGCLACAARFLGVMLLLLVMIFALPYVEDWSVPESGGLTLQQRSATCEEHFRAASPLTSGCENADVFEEAGRSVDEYIRFNASAVQRGITPEVQAVALPESSTAVAGPDVAVFLVFRELLLKGDRSVLITFFGILVFLLTVTVLFAPFLPSLFISVVTITGPLLGLTMIMLMLQYRIYGPLTGQALMFGQLPFSEVKWRMFVRMCLMAGIVVVPFHNELRRLWHWYYLRTLQRNFFHGGKDMPFSKLAEQPLCPLLILTGTVTDYRRLGKQTWPRLLLDRTQTIAEISFTALHTGSTATGFIRTTYFRTLAKCTALTGAGCLDALSLSMSNRLRFRFWLEILNLSWGDYIFFSRRGANRYVERVANVLQTEAGRKFRWIAQQFPALFIWASTQVLLTVGWTRMYQPENTLEDCSVAKSLVLASIGLCISLIALSFFAFLPGLHCLMVSPIIRQFHQATRFIYRGERAPRLVYVTDGGVQDCTAIVQLMRRRRKRILLVLAAADPHDELEVLWSAMCCAIDQQVGTFFDPSGNYRDVRAVMQEFGDRKEMAFLRLGIRYGGWSGAKEEAATLSLLGELLVVKNRMPPCLRGMQAGSLLTEEEVKSGRPSSGRTLGCRQALEAEDLGGFCCCDCCHGIGCNCGPKFPHLSGANYLWLTPILFANLCRLGYEASEEVVAALEAGPRMLAGSVCFQQESPQSGRKFTKECSESSTSAPIAL